MPRRNVTLTMPMLRRAEHLRALGLSWAAVRLLLEDEYGVTPCDTTLRRYAQSTGRAIGRIATPSTHAENIAA